MNAIDLCTLLQKTINSAPDFNEALLKSLTEILTAKNIIGTGLYLDNLSKTEYAQMATSNFVLKNNVFHRANNNIVSYLMGFIFGIAIFSILLSFFLLPSIVMLLAIPLFIGGIIGGIIGGMMFAFISRAGKPFIAYLKMTAVLADLFSFDPEKHNQNDFWLSTDSRYQKKSEKGLLYVLEPLAKIGKGALKVLTPFKDRREGLAYTGQILAQSAKGIGNIISGLSQLLLAPPLLLVAGSWQALLNDGGWLVAKETVKRTALVAARGLTQTAFGVFQTISALPALAAPFIRLAMTAVRKPEKSFIKTKPEMGAAVDACLRVLANSPENEQAHVEQPLMGNHNADEKQVLLDNKSTDAPHPGIQSKEAEPFMCVRRQLEKVIKPEDRPKFDSLLKFSFLNTRGKVKCSAEEKI
ncbi:MAG: hypothetical protein HKM04_10280 [Legionellales bacterium]|nr:hypothetical protein [Legionellales bacterium]